MDDAERLERGVQLGRIDGRRSSQRTGKKVFAQAAGAVDGSLAARIEREGNWRKSYLGHVRELVEAGARSAKDAVRIAAEGADAVHRSFVFLRGDELPLVRAMTASDGHPFRTAVIDGRGERSRSVVVPYRGDDLRGDALRRRLDAWQKAGVIEPSCAEAVNLVDSNPEWLDLSDTRIVLLGAGAEMGPFDAFSRWGATIVAVDVRDSRVWERVVATAVRGSGRVLAPMPASASNDADIVGSAGADLLAQTPEVRRWLMEMDGPLVVGNYVYADGSRFLRLAAALDVLTTSLMQERSDLSLAYLATPTDVFAVPFEVAEAVRSARPSPTWLERTARVATAGRLFVPNYGSVVTGEDGRRWGIADALVPQQGPNYALAKMLQRWRAVLARDEGILTSANVAPATRTRSVTRNKILNAAYGGAPSFHVEVFEPETSRALMATLLVHDLRNPDAPANPAARLDHPFDLFAGGAAHGGLWRLAHEPRSILPLAAVRGLLKNPVLSNTRVE